MPDPGRVSVALCTFDGARYLDAQLSSIVNQSSPVDEIVVGDDGSTDTTLDLLERWASTDARIRILAPGGRLGVTANFERTIQETTGDVIVLADQDDVWHQERVESALAELSDPAVLLVHSDARLVDGTGSPLAESLLDRLRVSPDARSRLARGDAFDLLMSRNLVTGATVAFRRHLAEEAAPFPPSWVHDEWLAVLAASRGASRLVERELIDYRIHAGNEIGASALTVSSSWSRLSTPRSQRNARLLDRAEALSARLSTGVIGEKTAQKALHEQVRSHLPVRRLSRVAPVIREWQTGRYRRFGLGAADVLRDLVQPA